MLGDQRERLVVENVGGVDDRVGIPGRGVTGREGAMDLPGRDRVDHHAVATAEIEDGEIGVRLLGETDHIEWREPPDPLDDRGSVVDVGRRAEVPGDVGHRNTGDVSSNQGGHGRRFYPLAAAPSRCTRAAAWVTTPG